MARQPTSSILEVVAGTDTLANCRVLLVDDDEDLREVLGMALGARGALVTAVDSATHALEALVTEKIDVVVSDVGMVDHSGFWLVTKIHELWADSRLPVLAMTGIPLPFDGIRRAGFDDVFRKPPDVDALCASIASLRGSRS